MSQWWNWTTDLSELSQRYLNKMDTRFKYNQDYILRPAVQKRRLKQNTEKLAEQDPDAMLAQSKYLIMTQGSDWISGKAMPN